MNEQEETKIITRKKAMEKGLKRYFTGKPCKHGHVAERYTGDTKCLLCNKFSSREYLKSEGYKVGSRLYQQSESRRAAIREYQQSEKYKDARRKHQQSEEYKAYKRNYEKSEGCKAYRRKYEKSEARTRSSLRNRLGINPPEELVKAVHANREIKRFIREKKQNQ